MEKNTVWIPIPGLDEFEASDEGHIRNAKTQKQLHECINNSGYFLVSCSKYGNFLVHRLVAMAFHSTGDFSKQVNHIDGNKQNNRPENLEWMTLGDNVRDFWTNPIFKEKQDRRRKQLSQLHKGKQVSEETRTKMSAAHKGKQVSEETRKKMKESHKGTLHMVWMNNGMNCYMVSPEKIQIYLADGYVRGRLYKNKEDII